MQQQSQQPAGQNQQGQQQEGQQQQGQQQQEGQQQQGRQQQQQGGGRRGGERAAAGAPAAGATIAPPPGALQVRTDTKVYTNDAYGNIPGSLAAPETDRHYDVGFIPHIPRDDDVGGGGDGDGGRGTPRTTPGIGPATYRDHHHYDVGLPLAFDGAYGTLATGSALYSADPGVYGAGAGDAVYGAGAGNGDGDVYDGINTGVYGAPPTHEEISTNTADRCKHQKSGGDRRKCTNGNINSAGLCVKHACEWRGCLNGKSSSTDVCDSCSRKG